MPVQNSQHGNMSKKKTYPHVESIPSDLDQSPRLQEELAEHMRENRYGEGDVFAVRLAFEEALANAIKHGNRCDASKQVVVRIELDPDTVRIEVEDAGEGFRPEDVPDPTAVENLDKPHGRGIFLMRQYMTSVTYNSRGNRVSLQKRRSQPAE